MRGGNAVTSLRPKRADGFKTSYAVCGRCSPLPVMVTCGGFAKRTRRPVRLRRRADRRVSQTSGASARRLREQQKLNPKKEAGSCDPASSHLREASRLGDVRDPSRPSLVRHVSIGGASLEARSQYVAIRCVERKDSAFVRHLPRTV